MSAATLEQPPATDAGLDPFRIGYRYVHTVLPDGTKRSVEVPLSEEDFLHPEEGDVFVVPSQHTAAIIALYVAIEIGLRGRAYTRVFADHRVDWQREGVRPHGPDLVVFDYFFREWDPRRGTIAVEDLGAAAILVVEVTSESTGHIDLGKKFQQYRQVGVPYYFVFDLAAPDGDAKLLAYRNRPDGTGFHEIPPDPGLGVLHPRLGLWFRYENGRVVVVDEDRKEILYPTELATAHERLTDRARHLEAERDAETERADAEKARATAEKARADAEKARADDIARELAEWKAHAAAAPQP